MHRVYSSLRKIDIVSQAPDGRRELVQTDHRTPDEIDAAPELSVLFALARALVPRRSALFHEVEAVQVRHVAQGGLHPRIARVLASTDTRAQIDRTPVDLSAEPREAPADLADAAFAALARRVLAREGLAADEPGLAAFEERCSDAPTEAADEPGYWAAVAELAAVTGEVIRALHGGRWVDDTDGYADIPFMYDAGERVSVNAVGKAVKFLRHGEPESPRLLLRALEDRNAPPGPVLFTLKPSGWGAKDDMVCEPLVELDRADIDVPLVVYGHDHPNTFAMLKRGETPRDLEALREAAIANLAAIELSFEKVELSTVTFWVGHGSYFAAEKLLDTTFMRGLHASIGEMLAVAVPEKGRLFVTDAVASPEAIAGFVGLARGIYERNEAGRQLSPTVFLLAEGAIVGVAHPERDSAETPSRAPGRPRLLN